MQQVVDLAHLRGWRCHHDRPARTDKGWRTAIQGDKGFPDLVLARKGRVIFAELKSETGKTTHQQNAWLAHLGHDVEVYLWRPRDLDHIAQVLARSFSATETIRQETR